MKGAKSLDGVRGNLSFILNYKVWATLVVFMLGVAAGFIVGSMVS